MNTKKTAKQASSIGYEEELLQALKDPEEALAYLRISLEDDDPRIFLTALRRVAIANGGVGALSDRTGLNREHLYRTLSAKGNPKLANIETVLRSLGMKLSVDRV